MTIDEFEEAWKKWIDTYGLGSNTWCCDMYDQRHRWVPIYFKDKFWAGMSSTQRSESMNFFFKGFLNINTTLKQFVEQFGFALAKRVKEEDKETFKSKDSPIQCVTEHIFENVFHQLYTSKKFLEFQIEVKDMTYTNAAQILDDGKYCEYNVTMKRQQYGKTKSRLFHVTMDRELMEMRYDCKNFEFKGILCSHLLRVFHEEELEFVPKKYILDRWRKDLPREHLKIPVPYYSLLEDRPKEMKKYEKMQSLFEPISALAMTNDKLYDEVKDSLSSLSSKAKSIVDDDHGMLSKCVENVGKVYGRRVTQHVQVTSELEANEDNHIRVTDPIDKRGRGRGRRPTKRKGYEHDMRKNKKGK